MAQITKEKKQGEYYVEVSCYLPVYLIMYDVGCAGAKIFPQIVSFVAISGNNRCLFISSDTYLEFRQLMLQVP